MLTNRFEEIKVDISPLHQDAQRTRERVTEVENCVSILKDQTTPLTCYVEEAAPDYINTLMTRKID